ncbi:UNVERIFIED_CONTAM: hypothetical protein Scaly_1733100 [Sesamum calycinum]|uniref:Uncharacterized protein n=1 Tax=Sesamum calycinum TaxID=2727403 RepID=A0AAW2NXJ4_9LAMI
MAHLAFPGQAAEQSSPCTLLPFRGHLFGSSWDPTLLHVEKFDGCAIPLSSWVSMEGGLGSQIRVWKDPWLPRPRSFRPITPAPSDLNHLRVADLIDPETSDWKVDLVQQLFWPLDSSIILTIPISIHGEEDLMVWHYSRNGYFSVRSAYHLAMTIEDRPYSSDGGTKESQW